MWKDIIKEDSEIRSISENILDMWKTTDWRTSMLDEIKTLPKKVDSLSIRELERIKEKSRLYLSNKEQRNKFERMMDKLIELKR
jgi:hypothetical protein